MTSTLDPAALGDTYAEITDWFFRDYLQRYITAVDSSDDHSFITDYWGAPLWLGPEAAPATVLTTSEAISAFFKVSFDHLQAAGYTHTTVLDRRVVVFNKNGAAIDVIWSRRRGDESEIERLAAHFIIARRTDGLRIVSMDAASTDSATLDGVWPIHRGEGTVTRSTLDQRFALAEQFTPSGVRYLQGGDGDAGLVVFTHGWRDSAEGWQWTIDELAGSGALDGRRVVSVQRKEVSRRDEDHAGLLDDFAAQVVEVVRHVARPQERVVVVGQSMGGQVAELAATQLTDVVAGLVLVTPAPLAGVPLPPEVVEGFKAGARQLDRVTAGLSRIGLVFDPSDTTVLRLIMATPPETERASLQSLAWISGHPQGRGPAPVTAPTLVVAAGGDAFFPEEQLRTNVTVRFADVDMAVVPDSGHFLHLERPEKLAQAVAEFLAKLG